jgi:hypothetical protein
MNTYLFTGTHPQFATINGDEYEMQPNNTIDLPDCDYVQTLVAKGFLTPVDAPVEAHNEEAKTEEATAEATAKAPDEANAEAQNETQTDSSDVEAQAPVKKSTKKGAQA